MGTCCSRATHGFGTEEEVPVSLDVGVSELVSVVRQHATRQWNSFHVGKEGRVSARVARGAVRSSRFLSSKHVEAVFARFHLYESFDARTFMQFYEMAHISLPRVDALFAEADEHNVGYIGVLELRDFFRANYAENVSEEECREIIQTYQSNGKKVSTPIMTSEGFVRMLSDAKRNTVMDLEKAGSVYQDMSYPLSEYYICSSHNTYLMGNQWNSKSSGEAIKRALLLGVRVIELDSWEDAEGNPIVNHGNGTTLCSPSSFQECVQAVRDYAFAASEFPVILTIENHCGLEAQKKQARILRSVLGEILFNYNKESKGDLEQLMRGPEEWLSPHELRNRVVVRDKPIKKTKKKDSSTARRASILLERHQQRKSLSSASTLAASLALYNSQTSTTDTNNNNNNASTESWEDQMDSQSSSSGHGSGISIHSSETKSTCSGPQQKQSKRQTTKSKTKKEKKAELKSKNNKNNGGKKTLAVSTFSLPESEQDSDEDEEDETPEETEMMSCSDQAMLASVKSKSLRKSVRKRFSKRVSKSFRPYSGNLSRVPSIASRGSNGSTSSDEDELDERAVEHLTDFTETVKLNSASRELLNLMYIKNFKLKFKIVSGSGIQFDEPVFKTSSSIDEKKLAYLTRNPERSRCVELYAKNHLLRIYPAGQRLDSSNFNPVPAWNVGCQMVALNYQTNSFAVWLSQGKFADNGGCGYLLKPPSLRRFAMENEIDTPPMTLRVKVISGHYLIPNFSFGCSPGKDGPTLVSPSGGDTPEALFVEVSVSGKPSDNLSFRTRQIRKNCFNPMWNQTCRFPVHEPDFALVSFHVKDTDENMIGQLTLPVTSLRSGFRVVPLRSASSVALKFSYLFCKFDFLPMS